jgi:hypothetical protein
MDIQYNTDNTDNTDNKDDKNNIINNIINNITNNITNYLIDNEITINDDDDIYIKIKKFLLKYKRIISIICLIILLIIGYTCDFYHIINNDYNDNQIQNGGATPEEKAARKEEKATLKAKGVADRAAERDKAAEEKAKAKKEKSDAKAAGPGKLEKMSDKGAAKMEAHKQSVKDFKKKAKSLSTYTNAIGSASSAAGDLISNNADLIFQIFYSIAIFILICIVTIPFIAFIVVGIICFVLLKPKIDALKEL